MSAAPKSRIKINAPTHTIENIMKRMIFFDVCIFSSVAAPTKINATLTNSEGCIVNEPMLIQFLAPYFSVPKIRLTARSNMPAIATGILSFIHKSTSPKTNVNTVYATTLTAKIINCLKQASGFTEPITVSPTPDKKNAINSSSKFLLCTVKYSRVT